MAVASTAALLVRSNEDQLVGQGRVRGFSDQVPTEFDARGSSSLRHAIEHGIERNALELVGEVLTKVLAFGGQG